MVDKTRIYYTADGQYVAKNNTQVTLTDSLKEKIDGIENEAQKNKIEIIKNKTVPYTISAADRSIDLNLPLIVDNTLSTSKIDALSANQWKLLQDEIDKLKKIWKFLSVWNSTTGKPVTDPTTVPYTYTPWDYYLIGATGDTNYKPTWTVYTWAASTTIETEEVHTNYIYFFDWTNWILNRNTPPIVIDSVLSTTSENPVQNKVITLALEDKAEDDEVVHLANAETITGVKTFKVTSNTLSFDGNNLNFISPSTNGKLIIQRWTATPYQTI